MRGSASTLRDAPARRPAGVPPQAAGNLAGLETLGLDGHQPRGQVLARQRAASHLRKAVDDRGLDAAAARRQSAAAIRWACASMSAEPRPSIRSVGTSPSARCSSRNSTSVASSAASDSLSTRTIRASGFLRIASIHRALPRMIPPCGPPIILSALQVIRSAPAATDSASVGSGWKPNREKSMSGAGADVVDDGQTAGLAEPDQFAPSGTSAVKPTIL